MFWSGFITLLILLLVAIVTFLYCSRDGRIGYDDISCAVMLCCGICRSRHHHVPSSSSHEVEVVDSSLIGRPAGWLVTFALAGILDQ